MCYTALMNSGHAVKHMAQDALDNLNGIIFDVVLLPDCFKGSLLEFQCQTEVVAILLDALVNEMGDQSAAVFALL